LIGDKVDNFECVEDGIVVNHHHIVDSIIQFDDPPKFCPAQTQNLVGHDKTRLAVFDSFLILIVPSAMLENNLPISKIAKPAKSPRP